MGPGAGDLTLALIYHPPMGGRTLLRVAVATTTATIALAVPAAGQNVENLADEVAAEQSCRALAGGTVGAFDEAIGHTVDSPDAYPVEPGAGVPASWAPAPAELRLPREFPLRTTNETFNRRYSFAPRAGRIYVRSEDATARGGRCRCPPALPVGCPRSPSTTTR